MSRLRDHEFNSDINHYVSYSGFTPLHYAIIVDDIEMVKYLLDHGADPTLENNRGYKPANYCVNESIKALLEEYTNKVSSYESGCCRDVCVCLFVCRLKNVS